MVNRDLREKKEEISVDGQKKSANSARKTEKIFLNVFNCSKMAFGRELKQQKCDVGTESSAIKSVIARVRCSGSG